MGKRILIEHNLCTGCMICAQVCSLTKSQTCNPARARIRIVDWEQSGLTVPVLCQDCAEPVCRPCCPEGAIHADESSGVVSIDKDLCTNCRICIEVCPYGGPIWDPVEKQVFLCDHCEGRPACVSSCPTGALSYSEINEQTYKVRERGMGEIRKSITRLAGV